MAHILITASDADVRAVIAEVVREAGHVVTEVGTLTTALDALLASGQPYIVLVDTYLDGDHMASAWLLTLASEGFFSRHTFVLLSTDSVFRLPPVLRALRGKLVLAVVNMPFDVEDLLHAVERAAERLSPPAAEGAISGDMDSRVVPEEGEQNEPRREKRGQQDT